jgi:two-component system phosphate regulon sensor histidine kinase PhoR
MNQKFIKNLIFSSVAIIIALIGVQIYWIKNSFDLKKSHFDQSIHNAIYSFAQKYERYENFYLSQNKSFSDYKRNQLKMVSIKSQIKAYSKKEESGFKTQHDVSVNVGSDMIRKASPELVNRYGLKDTVNNSDVWFKINITDTNINITGSDLTNTTIETPQQLINKDEVPQMDKNLVDSLIKIELRNVGIDIDYEFVVLDIFNFPVCGRFKTITKLVHTPYSSSLYPNAIFGNDKYIKLYFPEQKTFLFKEIVWALLISALLIFFIVFIFYKSISTILHQKKLSVIKNDFINNMTHELKTPISTISIACEALNDPDVTNSEEVRKSFTNIINEENKRLSKMVETVLKNATYEKSNFNLSVDNTDIHDIVNKAIENIEFQVASKNGIVKKLLNAENTMFYLDRLHIHNAILNILDNANKYSIHGKTEITVETRNEGNGIYISIKDKGIGISKEEQQKIFDKFYRVSTGNIHNVKGFGLGLSYAHNIVKKHGGNISVNSEKNKGSEFIIFLPYNQ